VDRLSAHDVLSRLEEGQHVDLPIRTTSRPEQIHQTDSDAIKALAKHLVTKGKKRRSSSLDAINLEQNGLHFHKKTSSVDSTLQMIMPMTIIDIV
jgi:hypothetical protein